MTIKYVGLAEKVEDGYSVFFPDFPGFGSGGRGLEETRKNAYEGLKAHIELMLEAKEAIPKPSPIDEIMELQDAKNCIPIIYSNFSNLD